MSRRFAAFAFYACSVLAQSNFATISGRVEDASHAAIEGARVTIRAKDTGAERSFTSNAAGLFEAANLPPGDYTACVGAPGFAPSSRAVTLAVGQNMGLELILDVGGRHRRYAEDAGRQSRRIRRAAIDSGSSIERPYAARSRPLRSRSAHRARRTNRQHESSLLAAGSGLGDHHRRQSPEPNYFLHSCPKQLLS